MKTKTRTRRFMIGVGITVALLYLSLLPVPVQADLLDLTSAGSSGFMTGDTTGGFFVQIDPRATGSGVIDPFVRISSNDAIEQGYNTSGRPLAFDENSSPIFTHDLALTSIPIVNILGIDYRQFMLDINQTGVNPYLSLDKLQIYESNTGNFADPSTDLSTLGTLIYSLDGASVDNYILLNYNLNTGSGSGDMFAYIPDSLFSGEQFVYLYSLFGTQFGDTPLMGNNDGFEEWAVLTPTPPQVPEPGMLMLFGSGLVSLAFFGRKKFRK